jgi:Tripartite tricarboxylate transporter family receptor
LTIVHNALISLAPMPTAYHGRSCHFICAATGVGASHHLYGEMFKSLTGVQMTHVPYRGTVPALNDVIGHIPLLFSDPPPALPSAFVNPNPTANHPAMLVGQAKQRLGGAKDAARMRLEGERRGRPAEHLGSCQRRRDHGAVDRIAFGKPNSHAPTAVSSPTANPPVRDVWRKSPVRRRTIEVPWPQRSSHTPTQVNPSDDEPCDDRAGCSALLQIGRADHALGARGLMAAGSVAFPSSGVVMLIWSLSRLPQS